MENDEEVLLSLPQKYQDKVIIGLSVIYSFDQYLRVYSLGTVIYTRNTAENKT